jgi:proline iminopeptidase
LVGGRFRQREEFVGEDQTGVVQVDGASLRYQIEGSGPTCLVLGSIPFDTRVFSASLREKARLVFVDLRHFVPSDPASAPGRISIDTYADDIDRVREQLELNSPIVIGHSIHAFVAIEYARRYPAHVRGVVAIGAAPYASQDEYDAAFNELWQTASEERQALLVQSQSSMTPEIWASSSPSELFVRRYAIRGPVMWFDPAYDSTPLWAGVEVNVPVFERLSSLLDPYDLTGPEDITAAVLLAHGRHDYGNPYSLVEKHRHVLPRHTFVLFERSGHAPHFEEPERFDEVLLDWAAGLHP